MPNVNRFLIDTMTAEVLEVFVEPECVALHIANGECITVHEKYTTEPVTVRVNKDVNGKLLISLWPGDGDIVVEKNGINVMEGL